MKYKNLKTREVKTKLIFFPFYRTCSIIRLNRNGPFYCTPWRFCTRLFKRDGNLDRWAGTYRTSSIKPISRPAFSSCKITWTIWTLKRYAYRSQTRSNTVVRPPTITGRFVANHLLHAGRSAIRRKSHRRFR